MNEKQRYAKLTKKWVSSGIGELEDEKLDFFMEELKKFRGWNRKDRVQQKQVRNLLKKTNDRLEKILREKNIL